jgi:hypothetical protein
MTVFALTDRQYIGGNNPPTNLDHAREETAALSQFLSDHPVIENEDQARNAKGFVDRTRATLGTLEDERDAKVRPLNQQVAAINSGYKAVTVPLVRVLNELRLRLTGYAQREEDKRLAKAEALRREAELADMNARLAAQREADAKQGATFGEITQVGEAIVEADGTAAAAELAKRLADRAERDSHVKIGGGFSGKALSLKSTEILILDDAHEAIRQMGVTEKIREAILSSARDYRKLSGALPFGVSATTERKV